MSKISFTTMGTPELDAFGAIDAAVEYGFDGVDLRISRDEGEIMADMSDEQLAKIKAYANEKNIELPGLLCYFNRTIWESFGYNSCEEYLLRLMEIAEKLGSKIVRYQAGDASSSDDRKKCIEDEMKIINDVLAKNTSDVMIGIQNHANSYTVSDTVYAASLCPSNRLCLIYSPDHCFIIEEDVSAMLDDIKKITPEMYVSDIIMIDGKHQSVAPGEGGVDNKKNIDILGGKDFDGWYTFKWERIWRRELDDYTVVFPKFMKFIKGALK